MIAAIPAYEPDERLPQLVAELAGHGAGCLVVDDGSGPAFAGVFAAARQAGATVLAHEHNRGKGAALRTAYAWCAAHAPRELIVSADADGQHTASDICAVGAAARANEGAYVLGIRATYGPAARKAGVPWRSRLGGRVSSAFFRLATGRHLADTQTGLRACGPGVRDRLREVSGDRYEYEMNALLALSDAGIPLVEVPIETVYVDANASSHFRPVADSLRVMAPLVRFGAVGLGSSAFEMGLFLAFAHVLRPAVAVIAARAISGVVNFALNRHYVFAGAAGGNRRRQFAQYWLLAGVLAAVSALIVAAVARVHIPLVLAKACADVACWLASFAIQRRWVFRSDGVAATAPYAAVEPAPAHVRS